MTVSGKANSEQGKARQGLGSGILGSLRANNAFSTGQDVKTG